MNTMERLCSQCRVCDFLPEDKREPSLYFNYRATPTPQVLIIDTTPQHPTLITKDLIEDIIGINIPFTYSWAIRCAVKMENFLEFQVALDSCSVWTHQLLQGRKVILATKFALLQMGVDKERSEGELFKSPKYGVVLVIPSLEHLQELAPAREYRAKAQRALKEAGII